MFSKRNLVDIRKSTAKIQDTKKDLATRIKHLKIILENVDIAEAKGLFEANFSHVYHILYDSFVLAETNLRQRELSFHLVHKVHKEELDISLWILEQILCLLPELIHKRWQLHSLGRLLGKLLHSANSIKLRRQAIKYFLMWYQALNDNAPQQVHRMFAGLVPGFQEMSASANMIPSGGTCVFHDPNVPISATEVHPLIWGADGKPPDNMSKFFLEALLEGMVQTVVKLEWQEKVAFQHRCFHFMLEQFKLFYLPKICPKFCYETSLYQPNLELPELRRPEPDNEFIQCRVALILWVASNMHQAKVRIQTDILSSQGSGSQHEDGGDTQSQSESSTHHSLDSTMSSHANASAKSEDELAQQIVRDVLCSSRTNVNFVHEIYRQALLLNFHHVTAIRKVISVYRDLIHNGSNTSTNSDMPAYALEPLDDGDLGHAEDHLLPGAAVTGSFVGRLRTDSYLGAMLVPSYVSMDHTIRSGMQNVLQVFMTHVANVFLLDNGTTAGVNQRLLEEQTDACKRVLNIYRYMVMNTRMDATTWEQLLLVLLQITSLVLSPAHNRSARNPKGAATLGTKLAAALFQTLIVTWVKANLNVLIGRELWDRFLHVLTSLTHWEELIKEWAKTMETLTRVLARHVYNLDLTDLPLDRLTEQKSKRARKWTNRHENTNRTSARCPPVTAIGGTTSDNSSITSVHRQDSSLTDGSVSTVSVKRKTKLELSRSYSETNLTLKRKRAAQLKNHRRSVSLDNLLGQQQTSVGCESGEHTRSPSPAPSSGMETNSIKDSPMQLDVVLSSNVVDPHQHILGMSHFNGASSANYYEDGHVLDGSGSGDYGNSDVEQGRGVICGGRIRGWLPDVAVILWRRMLGALGDVNTVTNVRLHAQIFEYLVKLTETLIEVKRNQGVSVDNQTTPNAPELVPPLTLILPWCFACLTLPDHYEPGKLYAMRLVCDIMLHCDAKHTRPFRTHFYRFIHAALNGDSYAMMSACIRHLGGRFLSLNIPGSSILVLDLINSCNIVLSAPSDPVQKSSAPNQVQHQTPRVEAITMVANILTLYPSDLKGIMVLQPERQLQLISCPDIREHAVAILLRTGRKERKGKARCIALTALAMFVYKELLCSTFHPKLVDALNVIVVALKFNNKIVVQLASNLLYTLCDHSDVLWKRYTGHTCSLIRAICSSLYYHIPMSKSMVNERDKALCTGLLLCLGEWCMRLGPQKLMQTIDLGPNTKACLLLQVFNVLHKVSTGHLRSPVVDQQSSAFDGDDFDPTVILSGDDVSDRPSASRLNNSMSSSSPSKSQSTQLSSQQCRNAIVACARSVLAHLVTHLGHFPIGPIGATRLSSLVVEHDDVPNLAAPELSSSIFAVPNIQLVMLNKSVIASLIELPTLGTHPVAIGMSTADRQVRILLRDLSGKSSWDASILYKEVPASCATPLTPSPITPANYLINTGYMMHTPQLDSMQLDSLVGIGGHGNGAIMTTTVAGHLFGSVAVTGGSGSAFNWHPVPQRAIRHRQPNILPDMENRAPDLDQLDDLLQYIGHTSPECVSPSDRQLNQPIASECSSQMYALEQDAIGAVIAEKRSESMDEMLFDGASPPLPHVFTCSDRCPSHSTGYNSATTTRSSNTNQLATPFQQCRLFFSQMGWWSWARRKHVHLLQRSERLLRELRNLDGQRCRETHKVALVYVAPGQEDKNSILSNEGGSAAYEAFVAALAWEVELEGRTGFLGGLQRQGSTGLTAPYVATSFAEVIFHVATRMPGDSPENILNKTRHLGNDEVHIVWSEHNRDYRRDIIPTEFCDILIIIYPLPNTTLHRVTLQCKPDVPLFGILFDEAIVDNSVLPGLVRAAAVCGSRAKRTTLPFFQQYYEERALSLATVMTKHKHSTTFEEFISRIYSPLDTTRISANTSVNLESVTAMNSDVATGTSGSSTLAAALLDSNNSNRYKLRDTSGRGVWFNSSTDQMDHANISPRPLKKASSGARLISKRSQREQAGNDTIETHSSPSCSTTDKEHHRST